MAGKEFVRLEGSSLVSCHVESYETQFMNKQQQLRDLLKWDGEIEAFSSPTEHFRMRANFQLWHDDNKNKKPEGAYYAMFQENDKRPCEITSFPRGTLRINELMTSLKKILSSEPLLFGGLFEVRFVTTLSNQAIVVLLYRKPLPEGWLVRAEEIAGLLQCKIIGRARKEKLVTGGNQADEFIEEILKVNGREYKYFQTEGAFSQPNAIVCQKMIGWALDVTGGMKDRDLLELYCGGGTFTAPLSTNFRQVLATEVSKASVELAQRCFAANELKNIKVARLSSEEFTEAFVNKRSFRRCEEAGIKLSSYDIQTVFVDPPRAGMDEGTCRLISRFERIVYVSCNPVTLARDIKLLADTHDVVRVAAFDQFPYTHHLESGVLLVRKPKAAEIVLEELAEPDSKRARLEDIPTVSSDDCNSKI